MKIHPLVCSLILLGGSIAASPLAALPKASPSQTRAVAELPEFAANPRLALLVKHLRKELGLSPEQIRAARVVLLAHEEAVSSALDEVVLTRAELRLAIRDTTSDDATLIAAAETAAAAQRELLIATTLLRADLYPLLTPTQAERLERIETAILERIERARDTFGEWLHANY